MRKAISLIIGLSMLLSASAQQLNTSNPRLWFWDQAEALTCINYNGIGPNGYSSYWTWTACTQNTCGQDNFSSIALNTTYKRTGNSSYKMVLKFHPGYPCNGTGCQHLRNELGIHDGGTQANPANEYRWNGVSIMIDPASAMESRRYQIAFDHKESPDNAETPFWLGIVGQQDNQNVWKYYYCLQGRYVNNPDVVLLGEVVPGVWVDWLLERNWTQGNDGFMRFYRNGVKVWEYYGPNTRSGTAFMDRIQHGFYKWAWANNSGQGEGSGVGNTTGDHIMYMDEIRIGKPTATLADMLVGGTPANQPPVANAGPDQTITLPQNTTILNGSGTDVDGTISAYQWTKISGPAGGNITSINSATTGINTLQQGTYVYQLRVTDNSGNTGFDVMSINVTSNQTPNVPPSVYAGNNQTIVLPLDSVYLGPGQGGVASSDPDGFISSYRWRREYGSGTIATPISQYTRITGLTAGESKFWLTVTDNSGDTATDFVIITTLPAPVVPQKPVATVTPETQTVFLPTDSAYLDGSTTYSLNDSIQTYAWTKISGPSGGSIRTADKPATFVYGMGIGTYTFRLIATTYAGLKDTADATVVVGPIPVDNPPVINITGDTIRTIRFPTTESWVYAQATDDGVIQSILWQKVGGPSGGNVVTANNDTTLIKDLYSAGTYDYTITVIDNQGQSTTRTLRINVQELYIIRLNSRQGKGRIPR